MAIGWRFTSPARPLAWRCTRSIATARSTASGPPLARPRSAPRTGSPSNNRQRYRQTKTAGNFPPFFCAQTRRNLFLLLVRRDGHLEHLVGVGDGAAALRALLDLVDEFHARDHFAPHGVLAVEELGVGEADEELAARAVRV